MQPCAAHGQQLQRAPPSAGRLLLRQWLRNVQQTLLMTMHPSLTGLLLMVRGSPLLGVSGR
jgi:hypothetical protein